jgi:hypothetical protein
LARNCAPTPGTMNARCIGKASWKSDARTTRPGAVVEYASRPGDDRKRVPAAQGRGKIRFFGEPSQTYWRGLLSDSGFASTTCAWVMYFDGQPVSFCFFMDCGDTRHIMANHCAEQVYGYGTGSILYRHVFRNTNASGAIHRVDIGLGDSGYRSRWNAQPSHRLLERMAFRPVPFGRLLELATGLWH